MMDVNNARIVAARKNLMRYRRILTTPLTDTERAYVRRRMAEERSLLDRLEQPPIYSSRSAEGPYAPA
jgi:hypothetical protein